MAADGTITFNGTVTASACTALTGVSVGGGAPAVNQTINLPAVPAPALNVAAGTYLGQTAFKISLPDALLSERYLTSGLFSIRRLLRN
jgi:major type 1 subunit fimbrin (pilin)